MKLKTLLSVIAIAFLTMSCESLFQDTSDDVKTKTSPSNTPIYDKFGGYKGNIEKMTVSTGEFIPSSFYSYNEFGGTVSVQDLNGMMTEFTYDANENLMERRSYTSGDRVTARTVYEYDMKEKTITIIHYVDEQENNRQVQQ